MESIDIMVEEHENIIRMTKVIRKYCYKVLTCEEVDYRDFYKIIDFLKNYADGHHHAKEEDILFKRMGEKNPKLKTSGPIIGMFIEHDLSRLHISNLELALKRYEEGDDQQRLDIIANAISYTDLLNRHIEKENTAVYKFAHSMLEDDVKNEIDAESKEIDLIARKEGKQEKYINLLEELEEKFC